MLPNTYGEMIENHLDEMRLQARQAREIRQSRQSTGPSAWRVTAGRLLMKAGEWLCGCGLERAGEVGTAARVSG